MRPSSIARVSLEYRSEDTDEAAHVVIVGVGQNNQVDVSAVRHWRGVRTPGTGTEPGLAFTVSEE